MYYSRIEKEGLSINLITFSFFTPIWELSFVLTTRLSLILKSCFNTLLVSPRSVSLSPILFDVRPITHFSLGHLLWQVTRFSWSFSEPWVVICTIHQSLPIHSCRHSISQLYLLINLQTYTLTVVEVGRVRVLCLI